MHYFPTIIYCSELQKAGTMPSPLQDISGFLCPLCDKQLFWLAQARLSLTPSDQSCTWITYWIVGNPLMSPKCQIGHQIRIITGILERDFVVFSLLEKHNQQYCFDSKYSLIVCVVEQHGCWITWGTVGTVDKPVKSKQRDKCSSKMQILFWHSLNTNFKWC